MGDQDVAAPAGDGIADEPVRGVVEGVAEHEDVAPRDGGVVRERQDVDPARRDGAADGGGILGEDGADDDLGAVGDGLNGRRGRLLRLGAGVVDAQVDLGALEIAHGETGRILEAARQGRGVPRARPRARAEPPGPRRGC
jgi:hypothetical protein